jgi:four helix bundle protein
MSVSANYRAARRARSKKEFTAKLGIVVEETDEVAHWLDLVAAGGYVPVSRLGSLQREVNELLAIYSRMARTARARLAAGTKVGAPESIATSPFRQITT